MCHAVKRQAFIGLNWSSIIIDTFIPVSIGFFEFQYDLITVKGLLSLKVPVQGRTTLYYRKISIEKISN